MIETDRKNIRRVIRVALVGFLIVASFVYGIGVGKLAWPPHNIIRDIYAFAITRGKLDLNTLGVDRLAGHEIQIFTGEQHETAYVTEFGKDNAGHYIQLSTPLKGGYQVGTKIRLSDDEYLSEIVGSKDDLLQKGFEVRNFTYPYNANDERARNLVSDHYESGRSSGSLKGFLPGINVFPLNRLALYSKGIDNSSEEEVTAILNEIVEHNALGIVYFHSDRTTKRRIEFVLDSAIEKGIDIVTRSIAVERFADNNPETPTLVVEYDDGWATDYTLAFPIHQKRNAPASIAVMTNNIDQSERFLSSEQIKEMVDAGWELMSHTRSHVYLKPALFLAKKANAGDTRLYIRN